MNSTMAFALIASIFAIGDFIALKTKGIVSTFITAIIVLVFFGGFTKILPENLMELSGLTSLIPTFGMTLILINLGSTLNLSALKKEWKTILVSLAGIFGIIISCLTLGRYIFGYEYALSSIAPIAGGIVATMITGDAAKAAGRADIAAFVASIDALEVLIGLPISSFCLNRAARHFVDKGLHNFGNSSDSKKIDIRLVKETPKSLDSQTSHFARIAIVGVFAQSFSKLTGLNSTLCFLLFGCLAGAIGIMEPGSLKKAGGDGILLLATYAYVTSSFLTLTLAEFLNILISSFGLLFISAVGIAILASIAGLLFKWDSYLSIAVAFSCMYGYPITYAVATEVANGISAEKNFTEEQHKNLTDYLLPKMIIAGVTTVSVASVVLAEIIAPLIF